MLRQALTTAFFVTLLSACADGGSPTAAPRISNPSQPTADMQEVARGFALALRDPAVRADVRDAMRASLLVQHRLVLRDFVGTPRGERFLSVVGRALDMDAAGVNALLAQLPELDFFVPAREDRRSWEATENVAVVGLVQAPRNGTALAFAPDGRRVTVVLGRVQPGTVLFQLSPAEFRDRRVNPQSATAGTVIEDANDGTYGGRFTWSPVDGPSVTIDLADLVSRDRAVSADCDPAARVCEVDGDVGGFPEATYLEYFYIHYNEPGACGDPDPTFKARYYDAAGVLVATGQLDYSEVPQYVDVYPHDPIVVGRIGTGSGDKIKVQVIDRDSWFCGGDDPMGSRDFFEADLESPRTIFLSGSPTANVTLGW